MIPVLHIDGDPEILRISRTYLEKGGEIRVDTCTSAEHALQKMQYIHYDIVVTDYPRDEIAGTMLLQRIRDRDSTIPVICFVGLRNPGLESVTRGCSRITIVDKLHFGEYSSFQTLAQVIREAYQLYRHGSCTSQGSVPQPVREVTPL